ncbi:MAG: hypothetical protein WA210_01740 [Burkholderiaceae bacterium]
MGVSEMPSQRQDFEATESAIVRLPGTAGGAPLSKAQKLFNHLIERIEAQRRLLAEWQEFVPKFEQRVAGELDPLQQRCDRGQLALATLYDAAVESTGFTKRERAKLAMLVRDICSQLLMGGDPTQVRAEIVALHDKYSATSHADLKEEETELFKDMAETIFGVELDADEASRSPESIREALHRKMAQQRAAQAEPSALPPRKSAQLLARQARQAEQAQAATQSVREIFRKLASALHPDRETEAAERTRKTALMQQVNQAYAQKNLLRLLELQIQVEQIDAAALGSLSPARLGHYNQVLTEQCAQLEHEVDALVAPFVRQLGGFGRSGLTPQTVNRSLDGDIAAMRRDAQSIEHDLKRFSDRAVLKAWLKHVRVERQRDADTTLDGFDELFDAFSHTR